jgi:HSP20 family protein
MAATREIDRTMNETNGDKKGQNVNREMSRPAVTSPTPYRRGAMMSNWGHEPFRRMREEFDRMFEQWFGSWPAMTEGRQLHWGFNVTEEEGSIVVRAEAPGFEPGDFDVQVRGDQLILRASHKSESQEKQQGYREWQQQEFYRSIELPIGTDDEKVDARYRNGILTVTLAKTEEFKGRHIAVKG